MPPDPYQPVVDTPPVATTDQAAAQISRMSALDRLRGLLGPAFSSATVTTDYGGQTWGTLAPHTGIDLAAAQGTPIREPIGGVVRFAQDSHGGNQTIVTTPQGFREVYAHLSAFPPGLFSGSTVVPGQLVGYVGQTGMASGPHLHYEVTNPGGAIGTMAGTVDPLAFIGEFVQGGGAGPSSGPGPLSPDRLKEISDFIANLSKQILWGRALGVANTPTDAQAAEIIRQKFPDVPAAQLAEVARNTSAGPDVGLKGIADAITAASTNIGNVGKALTSVSTNVTRLTGDLTNPQTWAKVGLTLAAVGLIVGGIALYALSTPGGQRAATTVARVA